MLATKDLKGNFRSNFQYLVTSDTAHAGLMIRYLYKKKTQLSLKLQRRIIDLDKKKSNCNY